MNRQLTISAFLLIVLSLLFAGAIACGGDDDDEGGPAFPQSDDNARDDNGGDDSDGDGGSSGGAGTIEVTIGSQTYEFITEPPMLFEPNGNTYGSCFVVFGTLKASGYTADGSVVASIQITEPGVTGSWITVSDGDRFLDGDGDATFLWDANKATRDADDPRYSEVADEREVSGSAASGKATFINAVAETPEQVPGSYRVSCPE